MAINQISGNIYSAPYNPVFGTSNSVPSTQRNPDTSPSDQPSRGTRQDTGTRESHPYARTGPASSPGELTTAERMLLAELKNADTRVRQHEMAHVAAGAGVVTSGASFTYKKGPDGQNYAVAGEVSIDAAPVPGDPQATIRKMQQVRRAALAPASPSPQDIKVASRASALAAKAASELMILQAKERAAANESRAFGNMKNASNEYTKVSILPGKDTQTIDLAV
ncbi:MAG: putative metalloprotease CJM1_0395 family protein [Desulfotignum sp.]|nr:SprA-related family protein [Desulfobacteraceae bacterium]